MDVEREELFAERFDIEREIGRGAVGIVYRAIDAKTGESIALKIIAEANIEPAERARFTREGQVLSEISHECIVRVVAFGQLDEAYVGHRHRYEASTPYVAMEWLDGEDLSARQARSPLNLRQTVDVGRQMARALTAAHQAGVIHRDIKPSNIILVGSGPGVTVAVRDNPRDTLVPGSIPTGADAEPNRDEAPVHIKLVDFGVAAQNDVRLTQTGAVVGTPAYMAPEQARGDTLPDARSDIYSLGATLFELVAGRPPHVGPTSIATLARLVTTDAPRLSDILVDVPPELDELIARMLRTDRDERPSQAREVFELLDRLYQDPKLPLAARPISREESSRGSVGTRLVTTIVALHVATGEERNQQLEHLRSFEADALPLGSDSIVAHLGARKAHGDEATRALELGSRLAKAGARVGVATGRTRVDLHRSSGEIVDRAAALARNALDGKLIADLTTTELARGRFEFDVPGSSTEGRALRGPTDGAQTSPFVGRDAETASILSSYERCADDLTPLVISISGPPGIGKSRLGREFVNRVAEMDDAPQTVLVRCESYGRAQGLGVAADALRGLLGLAKGASLEDATQAVADVKSGDEEESLLPRLLANRPFPEGIEPRAARDSLYVSMTELVLTTTSKQPLALVVEDAQWADPESIAWIDHLLGRASGRPMFALLLMRPSFWRENPQRFAGRDHVRVELRPIAKRATREIARAVIGPKATEEMLDDVAQKAAGSPLFAEALARLIAAGRDTTTAATIEAAIQVSLDALDDTAREAVIKMSVFGMRVWDQGLTAIGIAGQASIVKKLVAAELLVEQAVSRFSNAREFLFKHGLVRDVAYQSADQGLKKSLHAAAGEWLHKMGEDAATVAQHFDLGGQHEKAADLWEDAARRALATNSLADAVKMADRALIFANDNETGFARAQLLEEAYSRLDSRSSERESALIAMREHVFDEASGVRTDGAWARYDHARAAGVEIEARLTEVREHATKLGLVDEAARCSATLAARYAFAGQLPLAEAECEGLLALAEEGIVWAAVDAWQNLAVVRQTRGELASALGARRSAAKAARTAGLQEREATLTMNLGFALTTIGAREEALHEIESGIAKANAIGSLGAVRHGQMNLLGWAATFGADSRLDAELDDPRETADEAASGVWVLHDRSTLGVLFYRGCELLRGDASGLPRARALLKTAAEAYRQTQNRDVLPVALGFWAESERRFGNPELAIEIASEAAELLEHGAPSLLNEAPIYLALHDACVDTGDLRKAREAMQRGIVPLLRRVQGLEGTEYARNFLLGLTHNSGLLVAAEAYGCVPEEIERILAKR